MNKDKQSQQVEQNYKVFKKQLPDLLKSENKNKFALMKDGKIVGYYNTFQEADLEGLKKYTDDIFSVQEITNKVLDFGFYSNVVCFK